MNHLKGIKNKLSGWNKVSEKMIQDQKKKKETSLNWMIGTMLKLKTTLASERKPWVWMNSRHAFQFHQTKILEGFTVIYKTLN